MKTLFISADPAIAAHAERCGVDVLFIDMESRGKAERQGHLDTHKAAHTLEDVSRVRAVLHSAELMVRVNPPWEGTQQEVRDAVGAGAQRLMLPMFRHVGEVAAFREAAADTPITLLVETAAALARLPLMVKCLRPGDRVHFGLNDLSIDMGLAFLFEVLGGRLLDGPAAVCREAGIPFGIGGVGRVGQGGMLPAEWILGEHVRLGSKWVILSRAFHGGAATVAALEAAVDLKAELAKMKQVVADFETAGPAALLANHDELARKAAEIAKEVS